MQVQTVLLFLKNLLFTIFVPGTVAVYVPVVVISHSAVEFSANVIAGGVLLLIGGSIYLWCLWDFAMAGRGTPLPLDPPKNLVVRGLYKYTRNPMYVGVVSAIFGWSLFFGSQSISIYGICVALFFHLMVVLFEEPILRHKFGSVYDEYCSNVSRWLPLRKAAYLGA